MDQIISKADFARTLIIIAPFTALRGREGGLILTKKFVEGVRQYQQSWPGAVKVLIEMARVAADNLDNAEYRAEQLPFAVEIVDLPSIERVLRREPNSLVLATESYRQNHVAEVCNRLGLPVVYIAENTLATRLQMVRAIERNPLRKLRRYVWEWSQHRKECRAIARAQGVQCNGAPTFEVYRKLHPNVLLFFDTRMSARMLVSEAELERRIAGMMKGGPLRLFFSGRLIAMKGVDHLPEVARELERCAVDFDLAVAGAGDLEELLRRRIARYGLESRMRLMGNLDFESELIPYVKRNVDLFVCCHPQGDPSCTYLETMSCGVPIVGYANEAMEGIKAFSGSGWTTAMNAPREIAHTVAWLSRHREELASMSRAAIEFARKHTFEATFRQRVAHLGAVIGTS